MANSGRRRSRSLLAFAVFGVVAAGAVYAGSRYLGDGEGPVAVEVAARIPADSDPGSASGAGGVDVAPAVMATRASALVAVEMPPDGRAARPIVAEGSTVLDGGAVAVRAGDTVAVHFDTPMARTRRPEKFESFVRSTLPAIYGAAVESALAAVPVGHLAGQGDLLTELPEKGMRIGTIDGDTLVVWPGTRPGRDGPLVVTYRATILR